jgi:hypothetical protein
MPSTLETDDAVVRAEAFARQIKAAVSDVRKAKSADKAPFTRAGKVVDGFFESLSKPLDRALATVDRALDAARRRAARDAAADAAVTPIATGAGAQVVIMAAEPPASNDVSPEVIRQLSTIWKASFIDRGRLDLEALRDLMTDTEMDRLVARWLKENGPRPLGGVTWVEVVKT